MLVSKYRTVKYTIPTDFLTRNISCYTRCKREKYANLTSLHECISQYIQEEHVSYALELTVNHIIQE